MRLGKWFGTEYWTELMPPPRADENSSSANSSLSDSTPSLAADFWQLVKDDQRYANHDWTIKASPDTVFFPDRIRGHLQHHTPMGGKPLFFRKCDYSSPAYGLLEVRSRKALDAYFNGELECEQELEGWEAWSEDKFMQKCFDHLHVPAMIDNDMLAAAACG